jgi:predicted Zn-dependent protease
MIKKLKSILDKRKLDAWKFNTSEIRRTNFYYTKNLEKESVLHAFRINIDVTIYQYFGDEIGDSSFSVVIGETGNSKDVGSLKIDEGLINKKIDEALLLCNYSRKPVFKIPVSNKIPKCNLVDKNLKNPTLQLNQIYKEIKNELKNYSNITVNNLELYGGFLSSNLINNNGINYNEERTSFYIELTLTANKGGKQQEHVAMKDVSSLSKFNPKQFVKENVKLVNDILNSKLIKTFKGDVIISGDAISEFFSPHLSLNPLIMHASAKIKHMGISRYKMNKIIANFKLDKLTIATDPLLKLNPSSSAFDYDGVVSKKVKIIENGMFKNYFSNKQYADYLNIEATGAMGSINIKGGKNNINKIISICEKNKNQMLEIVSFSSFVPNSISGDFSAEIRLGYVIKKNQAGKVIKESFKGGMFTGNVFDIVGNMYLSSEIKETNGYHGPKLVVFRNAIVSGME